MGSLLAVEVAVTSPGEVQGCSQIRKARWWKRRLLLCASYRRTNYSYLHLSGQCVEKKTTLYEIPLCSENFFCLINLSRKSPSIFQLNQSVQQDLQASLASVICG